MPEDLIVNTLKMIPLDNIQKVLDNLVMESKRIYIIAAGSKMMVSFQEKNRVK